MSRRDQQWRTAKLGLDRLGYPPDAIDRVRRHVAAWSRLDEFLAALVAAERADRAADVDRLLADASARWRAAKLTGRRSCTTCDGSAWRPSEGDTVERCPECSEVPA